MRKHLIFCFFIFQLSGLWSQVGTESLSFESAIEDPYIKFDHLTREDGLSNNFILDILQDQYGYMWIATMDGLNRYDGQSFFQYKNNISDTATISSNHINCLEEDSHGNLWIGTDKGLNKYNHKKDIFETLYLGDTKKKHIRALLSDTNNILWIETAYGELLKYNTQKKTFKKYRHHSPSMVNTYFYHTIYRDNQGILWLGGRSMGIYSFNPKTEQFHYYKEDNTNPKKKRERDVSLYFQDSQGQMWIGGIDGLYTFDPKTEVFQKQCLSSSFSIQEDQKQQLWIATSSGIYVYNTKNRAINFMNRDDNNPHSLIHDDAFVVYIDHAQNVWIGTNNGISIYRPSANKFKHIYHILGDKRSPASSNTLSLLQLSNSEIWVGTEKTGIQCIDTNYLITRQFQHKKNSTNNLNSNKISVLKQDHEGDVWVGQWTGRGFNIITPSSELIKSYSILTNSLNADWYNDILEDQRGNYWIAIWGAQGIHQFDKQRGIFKSETFRLITQFENRAIKKLVYDGERIWLGLNQQNTFFSLDPSTNKINNHLKSNYFPYKITKITNFVLDSKNNIYIETPQNNYKSKQYPYISISTIKYFPQEIKEKIEKRKKHLKEKNILSSAIDSNGIEWEGNYTGLSKIENGKLVQHYSSITNKGLLNDTIWSIAFVPPDLLYLGTNRGLCTFNISTEEFKKIEIKQSSYISSHLCKCLAEDKEGFIWIGTTDKGLNRLNPETQKIKQYHSNLKRPNALWGKSVNCIFIAKDSTIWVGAKGLNRYQPNTDSFIHYTTKNGLCDDEIMSIQEDDEGKLWIATLNGLSSFDPKLHTFINYYKEDGLQDNEFSNASIKLQNGNLAFGGKNGITIFNPQTLFINKTPPKITFSSFKVFGKKIEFNPFSSKPVQLSYNENYFTIEYAALDFSKPDNIKYQYQLEGVDKDWIQTDGRVAKYTNIDYGNYTFTVKASNGDGVWNEEGKSIQIHISPPFWKTYWFILLELIGLISFIILIIKYRENKIHEKMQYQLLEQKLLRSQMNPHFIFNSLSSIQSFIFENNPLEAGSYLSRFAELIRSILYNSREEYILLEKEVQTLKNYFDLQQLRYNHSFDYLIEIDPLIHSDLIQIPPMLAQPFIENAIEHGIKRIKKRGLITVSFKLDKTNNTINLTISDNGIGLLASQKNKVKSPKSHKSLATVIAKERLSVLNKKAGKKKYSLRIETIIDSNKEVQGTKVIFIIPFKRL